MYCKSCGAVINSGASFCENCGAAVSALRYCENCGNEMPADSVICPVCGFSSSQVTESSQVRRGPANQNNPLSDREETLKFIVKLFMIIGCVTFGWLVFPLLWCIPLTVSVFNKFKTGEEITVGTKICVLIFVNVIGGICLLCMDD